MFVYSFANDAPACSFLFHFKELPPSPCAVSPVLVLLLSFSSPPVIILMVSYSVSLASLLPPSFQARQNSRRQNRVFLVNSAEMIILKLFCLHLNGNVVSENQVFKFAESNSPSPRGRVRSRFLPTGEFLPGGISPFGCLKLL